MTKTPLIVQGHLGLGDNVHQRGMLRELMKTHEVWLETCWASLYHDLIDEGLHLLRRPVRLRTQNKNVLRPSEIALFNKSSKPVPHGARRVRLSYHGNSVEHTGSGTILEAMSRTAGVSYEAALGYDLPVPEEWYHGLGVYNLPTDERPVLIYRPLVVRPEWPGNAVRNADAVSYARLFATIRAGFFVISVADLELRREWITGPLLNNADLTFHRGELSFEALAALFSYADLIYTSSGFGAVLGPAVGTPVVSVIGGYEKPQWHNTKSNLYCGVGPQKTCVCATSACRRNCPKVMDIPAAQEKIASFVRAHGLPVAAANLSEIYNEPPQPEKPPGLKA